MFTALERILRLIFSPKYINYFNMQKLVYFLITEQSTKDSQLLKFKILTNFNNLKILKNRLAYLKTKLSNQYKGTPNYQFRAFEAHFDLNFENSRDQKLVLTFELYTENCPKLRMDSLYEYV